VGEYNRVSINRKIIHLQSFPCIGFTFALGTFDTVFQAEVYAILACFDYCLRECMTGKTICICSDSRAALFELSSHTVSLSH
jgi:hypothetical protein